MSAAHKILVTCPPMLGMIDHFQPLFDQHGWAVTAAKVVQTLSVAELIELVPQHDGWIIGDDPATRAVFEAGKQGQLKAAVKWGIGVDNVDFAACQELGIPITNTPNMFGAEVADIAMGYVIALARETVEIDRAVRAGHWPKPRGISLAGKTVALVGFGDIGRNAAQRLLAAGMRVIAYDPFALEAALASGQVYSAALDVFEVEPLPAASTLRHHPRCVFGSHNASNTADAVARTSEIAIGKLAGFLAEVSP